ncbi:MAG: hypothetical protein LC776_06035, partial [Acidobacteria bacterium]|nr:hypothetical protein [Acidobacteriota bacterium]
DAGNLRAGLVAIMAASLVMLALHVLLTLRERRRSFLSEDALEREALTEDSSNPFDASAGMRVNIAGR